MSLGMAIYEMVTAGALFLAVPMFLAAPIYAPLRFFRSQSREVRRDALWLMAAWLCTLVALYFYFRSGMWYQESRTRPLDIRDFLVLAGWVTFGVVLPGIPFSRLLAAARRGAEKRER